MKKISWVENDTPKSENFGDIYYNKNSGLDEKRYVFVLGNKLDEKFSDLKQPFNILELGFGTGLSFLVTALEFSKKEQENELNFISTELYPLNYEEMDKALKVWGDFYNQKIVQDFLKEYKKIDISKDIRIKLGMVNLTVLVGDANLRIGEIKHKQDCFFLDGFAPGKNESMWSESLFELIKEISEKGSTAATYSASRVVKDRLEQAGFKYKKVKGFGHKRDMLIAYK